MKVETLYEALNEAEVWFTAGVGAASLYFTDVECSSMEETPVGANSALFGPNNLFKAEADSGERCGGVGEDKGPSPVIDASGGKHRWMRYLSTLWAGT